MRFYVVTRAAHPGYCVVDRESGLVVLDGLTKAEAAIEAQFRNEADRG